MKKTLTRIAAFIGAAAITLSGSIGFSSTTSAYAGTIRIKGGSSLGGFSRYLNTYYQKAQSGDSSVELLGEIATIPENVAIANVSDKLNVRKGPGTEYEIVGYMPSNAYCYILSQSKDGWVEIMSDDVEGFVKEDYLYTDAEGMARAKELGTVMATVEAYSMNLRSEPTTQKNNVISTLKQGEQYEVLEQNVVSKDVDSPLWVKVRYEGKEGYVCKSLVDVSYSWTGATAVTPTPTPTPAVLTPEKKEKKEEKCEVNEPVCDNPSDMRSALISKAKSCLGLKYVWAGNSLETGADCSGFCLAVYRACGIDTSGFNRCSYDIAVSSKGRTISRSELQVGDLIFYGKGGKINHVAMYYGNGKIIHESSYEGKCVISSMDYSTPMKYRNFLGD